MKRFCSEGRNGRDGKVFVWQLKGDGEGNLDCGLPADGGTRRKPWLLHSVEVKEMTFCGVDVAVTEDVSPPVGILADLDGSGGYFFWGTR